MGVVAINIIGKAVYLANGYLLYQILASLMARRKGWWIPILETVALAPAAGVIVYANDVANITLLLPWIIFVIWALFKTDWVVRISAVMLLYPIIIGWNFLSGNIIGRIVIHFLGEGTFWNDFLFAFFGLLTTLFWGLFLKMTRKGMGRMKELLDFKSWILLDVICLASMIAVYSFVYYTPDEIYKVYPGMAACLLTNIGGVRLAFYLADSIYADMDRKNLRLQQNYYNELEQNQLQIRKFRHDVNNHFAALGELLRQGRTEEALAYFDRLSVHMESRNRKFCENGIVNALLNVKYNVAVEEGIDSFFNISIDGMLGIDDISLCTILGNTLDNAVEACKKIEEKEKRRISVKARYTENGYFSYEVVNSKQNEIREKRGEILTDKEDSRSHGLGIASVRETVERYGGTIDIAYTAEEFRVVVLIRT